LYLSTLRSTYDIIACALGQLVKQTSTLTHEMGHASPQIDR